MKLLFLLAGLLLATGLFAQEKRILEPDFDAQLTKVTYFHGDGTISQVGFYDAKGNLHGEWRSYDPAGNELAQGSYDHGKKVGKWLFWNGDKLTEVDFHNSRILASTEWHTSCTLADSH